MVVDPRNGDGSENSAIPQLHKHQRETVDVELGFGSWISGVVTLGIIKRLN
jgi:hypothetical protein